MRTLKRITALEEELRTRLVASLQANASRVFLTTQIVDALHWPPGLGDATADELSARSGQLIHLYAREGIASAGTAAALYLAARDRWSRIIIGPRPSPKHCACCVRWLGQARARDDVLRHLRTLPVGANAVLGSGPWQPWFRPSAWHFTLARRISV